MMHDDPKKRPTAAECLKDSWMPITDRSDSLLTQKRGRSPFPSILSPASSVGQPLRKAIRTAVSRTIDESSTVMIMNAIFPPQMSDWGVSDQGSHGMSALSGTKMKGPSSIVERQTLQGHPRATQLSIHLEDDCRLSFKSHSHNDVLVLDSLVARNENILLVIVADNADLQDVTRRLLAAFQEESYGNNMTISGKTADVEVVREELCQLNILSLRV